MLHLELFRSCIEFSNHVSRNCEKLEFLHIVNLHNPEETELVVGSTYEVSFC